MGCYMSKPDDEVHVTEGKGRNFTYATASCQGWRREQEDAEACIPNFDDDVDLFILCDGHGGPEVAQYTVENFPNFLKEHQFYKQKEYDLALMQGFIDFDAKLRTEDVMAEVIKLAFDGDKKKTQQNDSTKAMNECSISKEMDNDGKEKKSEKQEAAELSNTSANAQPSGSSSGPSDASNAGPSTSNGASSIADDVDTDTLRREAQVPIEELISKYASQEIKSRILTLDRASVGRFPSKSKDHKENSERTSQTNVGGDQPEPTSSKPSNEGPSSTSSGQDAETYLDIFKQAMAQYFDVDDNSEDDSEFDGSDSDHDHDNDDEDEENGADEEDDDDDGEDEDEDGDDERDDDTVGEKSKTKRLLNKKQRRSVAQRDELSSEDDDDDDDDDEDSDESDDSDDSEDSDGVTELPPRHWMTVAPYDQMMDECQDFDEYVRRQAEEEQQRLKASRAHRPLIDSGCTVVVALIRDKMLYVGAAGDSRCIAIMRDGQHKEMSVDHKPTDPGEYYRIRDAGGMVVEGRVDGGLNLSRAFGDFRYKDPNYPPSQQKITPCPGVRMMDIDPEKVEYIFLACDGIWNSMSNEEVTKFIRETAPTVDHDLVKICMAIFKRCLAPGTDGDGTGCDNMTCILVRFNTSNETESSKTNKSDLKLFATNDENCTKDSTTNGPERSTNKRPGDDQGDNNRRKMRCLRLLED